MAKKRVHEIAKERGISSKEVLAALQQAGFDVKAAASSVDERDIARAFVDGAENTDVATGGGAADGAPPADDAGRAKAATPAQRPAPAKAAAPDAPPTPR
ncbi:MAG: translation initiation factor IF-2 N-terminal domain-containing protein, partial [Actinobacteria bacterium]|nr:translation initiation factor IF-2 N-terminal domain-containing protein [Actinomycetota bacterium]